MVGEFQWGHDPEVMVRQELVRRASASICGFQWGHDPEVMVRRHISASYISLDGSFQWGHDPEVMVRRRSMIRRSRGSRVSMGPRPGGHGKMR